jgi:hypothetical protein
LNISNGCACSTNTSKNGISSFDRRDRRRLITGSYTVNGINNALQATI